MNRNNVGAVVLRVILGVTFFIHGLSKFQGAWVTQLLFLKVLEFQGFQLMSLRL